MIVPNQHEFFIFGKPIFQGYYVTFNMEASSISFIPQYESDKPLFEKKELPETNYGGDYTEIKSSAIPLIFLVVATAIFFIFVRPYLISCIASQTNLYAVQLLYAAVTVVVYSILSAVFGSPVPSGSSIMDIIASIRYINIYI